MNKHLAFLEVLRATAALLVVGDHALYYVEIKQQVPTWAHNLAWHLGTLGVAIFFVISGFIMTYTAKPLFYTRGGWANFVRRRLIRIVPIYWAATAVELVLAISRSGEVHISNILHSLFFIPQVTQSGEPLRPILGVGWTLNHEMFFYAVFAVALAFPRRIGIFLVLVTLSGLVVAGSFVKSLADTSDPVTVFTFVANPLILLFAAGVVIAIVTDGVEPPKRLLRVAGPLALLLIAAGTLLFVVAVDQAPWPFGWQIAFWLLSATIVTLGILGSHGGAPPCLGWLERLGNASYSIYLFHFVVIAAFGRVWSAVLAPVDLVVFVPIAVLVATIAGWLVHVGVERPLLETLRRVRVPSPSLASAAGD